MTDMEKMAVKRVKRAGIKAPDIAILHWIKAVGVETILHASLRDILSVANAF